MTVTVTLNKLFPEECSVYRLVGIDRFSAEIGTVGDCCVVTGERSSGGSAFQTTGAATVKLRWPVDVFSGEPNKSPWPAD